LKSAAVLLSVAASAKRHGVNPWAYVQHILTASAARGRAVDFSDLLPDLWTQSHLRLSPAARGPSPTAQHAFGGGQTLDKSLRGER
jgi:hypothetical protein